MENTAEHISMWVEKELKDYKSENYLRQTNQKRLRIFHIAQTFELGLCS